MDRSATPIILCVDDDKVTLRAIERSLVSNGYSVLTADSGARALTTLQKARPDLILLDAVMPYMDGYEVCSQLQMNPVLSTIPIIFVTAQEEGEEKAKALAAGAADYLVKPIQRDVLLRKVALHISQNTARHPEAAVPGESSTPPPLHVIEHPRSPSVSLSHAADTTALANGKHESAVDASTWNAPTSQEGEILLQAHELQELLEEQTRQLSEANAALQAELVEQREIEESLRQTREDLEQRLQERTQEFEQLQATINELQSAHQSLEEALRLAQEHLDRQAQDVAQINSARESEREAWQQTEAVLRQEQDNLQRQLQEQTTERAQLQTSLNDEHAARQVAEQSLRELQEDSEQRIQRQAAEFEEKIAALQAALAERPQAPETPPQSFYEQELLITAIPDVLLVVNKDGTLRKWNQGLEYASGYTSEELSGMPALQLFDESARETVAALLSEGTLESQDATEAAFLAKDSISAPYQWKVSPLNDTEGQFSGFVLIGRDISERKQVELSLQQAREAAEHASQAKSEFLANMSHEIRTPMNGIIGMNELLLDTTLSTEQREYADTVKSSAEALLALLNDILDFSKIEARKLDLDSVDFSLRENLGDAMRALAFRAHQKGLELLYEVAPEIPDTVIGDPSRLRQIVTNLVGNALKFTEQGEVAVRVEKTDTETDGGVELRFAVRDTGIGIPKDKQQLIFQAFSQADTSIARKYGGTGLGLAISTQLVRLMNGYLWLESEEGHGSTFYFTARLGVGTHKEESAPAVIEELQGLAALVVDDNATNRRILKDLLTTWHLVPHLADSAESALTAMQDAKANAQPFAFVLIDGRMPGTDGITLAKHILDTPALAGATLMMLTSSDQKEERERLQQIGLSGFMLKPIRPSELLTALLKARGKVAEETRKAKTPFAQKSQKALRLLVAEDNAVNQKLAVRFLQKWGHEAIVAANGKIAYEAYLHDGPFDAILMDIEMPVMNGMEATDAIRRHEESAGTHIPIIAMTAHAMVGDKEQCLAAGMDSYVSKPLRAEELFATLEQFAKPEVTEPQEEELQEVAPPEEEVFDRAELLSLVDGDVSLLTELTDLFWESSPQLITQMRAAAHDKDPHTLSYAVHTLKGSVGNFAAKRALAALAQVEKIGLHGDLDHALPAVDLLEQELARLREALSSLKAELAA